jgi:hypothetical protein
MPSTAGFREEFNRFMIPSWDINPAFFEKIQPHWQAMQNSLAAESDEVERIKATLAYLERVDQIGREVGAGFDLDAYTRRELKNILASDVVQRAGGWITISGFGEKAAEDAFIVVQHADDDPDFQKEILEKLEGLYQAGEADPRTYAYLYDRVAVVMAYPGHRQLQRYGTQGGEGCGYNEEGFQTIPWKPFPMEDPARVDERRASVGLFPMAEYVRRINRHWVFPAAETLKSFLQETEDASAHSEVPEVINLIEEADRAYKDEWKHPDFDENTRRQITSKLKCLADVDQALRSVSPSVWMKLSKAGVVHDIDEGHRFDLKQILAGEDVRKAGGWVTISEFGREAAEHAWLIVQHADQDPEFQQEILAKLEEHYPKGDADPMHYALLCDRVLLKTSGKQRYGTQYSIADNGETSPLPIEDPENLGSRQSAIGKVRRSMDIFKGDYLHENQPERAPEP